jgi:phage baseplate assembly protein W
MANINLNNLFTKNYKTGSKVDSDINLNKEQGKHIIYSDCKFDLTPQVNYGKSINSAKTENDLCKIVNEESILNSLRNIMLTKFHSRLLNPEMNFDLRSYLFEELTEAKAFFIGYDISTKLPIYEPRIIVGDVKVVAYYNYDTYVIDLTIYIPSIDKTIKLSSILNSDGFCFS